MVFFPFQSLKYVLERNRQKNTTCFLNSGFYFFLIYTDVYNPYQNLKHLCWHFCIIL